MADREAIVARTREMYAAFGQGDVANAVSVYTDDAVVYQHGQKPISGRATIQRNMEMFASMFQSIELDSVEYFEQFNDTTAYLLVISKCVDRTGKEGKLKGSVLWRKKDGQWYTQHDVFNECPI